jgi:hypothetical protein
MRMFLLHAAMLVGPLALFEVTTRFRVGPLGVCLFKWATGIDCPGCGITRSVMALLGGHWAESFRFHPAGPIVLAIVALTASYMGLVLFAGCRGFTWRIEAMACKSLEGLAVGALLLGWIGKLLVN